MATMINYETVRPYPLIKDKKRLVMEDDDYRVDKMRFGKKDRGSDKDKRNFLV